MSGMNGMCKVEAPMSTVEDRLERAKNNLSRAANLVGIIEERIAPRPVEPCCGEKISSQPRLSLAVEIDLLGDRLSSLVERLESIDGIIIRNLGNIPLEY